ncbi:hypothetical protein HNP46_000202 [Pseudomonas nitritireducens]|uniref:Uncharacterized protein n=1 Tax=Pseudomonas nitroreducens TaxID=46680 RepID=A0A7W7KFD0_PSENT|nr:hypothetical protein [Pseudomonas nitritireducens]MBB4861391.1 hypothetical protein [Pseudomonas nitritireducens]
MGFIKILSDGFSDVFRARLNWRGMFETVRGLKESKETKARVSNEPLARDEFLRRYNRMRAVSIAALVAFVSILVMLMFCTSVLELVFKLISCVYFGLIYFRYAMQMWLCREAWDSQAAMNTEVKSTVSDFLNRAGVQPRELLPLKLSANGGPSK